MFHHITNEYVDTIECCKCKTERFKEIISEIELNHEIISIDKENNVILVKGNVPGPKQSLVIIRTAVKNPDVKNTPADLITDVEEVEVLETEENTEVVTEETETIAE